MIRLAPLPAAREGELGDLWVEAWASAMPQIDFEARRNWLATHLEGLRRDGADLIGAFDAADHLLGFVTVHRDTGEIDQLCVARAAQGRGLATRLLDEARHLSPQGLALTVNLDNAPALAFYERAGFRRGERGLNPRSGLPTVRMLWRPIPPP